LLKLLGQRRWEMILNAGGNLDKENYKRGGKRKRYIYIEREREESGYKKTFWML